MKAFTKSTKLSEITHEWHIIDAKDKVLGRMATEIAARLMGKSKPNFVRNLDCGDYVIVINSNHFVTTGKKENEKVYSRFSGYPGGLKQKPLWKVRTENHELPIRQAVAGMLPKNKLRDVLLTRLYIFPETDHPYKTKFTA